MAIHLGNNPNQTSMYYGAEPVTKICLGGVEVWPGGKRYGRAISIASVTDLVPDTTETYLDYVNWQKADAASFVDSDGNTVAGLAFNKTALSAVNATSLAVDTGNVHFDLYQKVNRMNNITSGEILNVTGVPYAKYDVFALFADGTFWTNNGATATAKFEVGSQLSYFAKRDRPNFDINEPREFYEYVAFDAITGSSFALQGEDGNLRLDLTGFVGMQIRERLDSLPAVPTSYPERLVIAGDSYSQTVGNLTNPANAVVSSHLRENWGFVPVNWDSIGAGGSNYTQQIDSQIETYDFTTPSVLIWQEGLAEVVVTPTVIGEYIERMRTAKGDEKWLFIFPVPAPSVEGSNNYATYMNGINAIKTYVKANYPEQNWLDTFDFIAATDPGDTSVGGLPASAYGDQFHLSLTVNERIVRELIGAKLRVLYEL